MARSLGDVLDAFIDGARPAPAPARQRLARQALRVPLAPGSRVAAALVESIAAQLSRIGVSVSLELLDPGARSLYRPSSRAYTAAAELTFQVATTSATARAQSALLICEDLAAAGRLGTAIDCRDSAREILVLDLATDPSESAAIQRLAQRAGALWIANVPPAAALRASVSGHAPNAAWACAAQELKKWLRTSHPLEAREAEAALMQPPGLSPLTKGASQ